MARSFRPPDGTTTLMDMRRLRRCTAFMVTLLTLQLIGLESGFACTMPSMGSSATAMAQMNMGGGNAASLAPQAPLRDHVPCDFPWAPGDCHGMTPCAPAALASSPVAVPVPAVPAATATVLVVLAPPARALPPEPPPPRA